MSWLEFFPQDWQNPETPLKWIFFMLVFVGILIFFIVLIVRSYVARVKSELNKRVELQTQHQESLIQNSIDIQERERERIAGNLHDDLIAQLYRIHLMNENTTLSPLIQQGIQTAREISHDLVPPLLEEASLSEAFENFLSAFQKDYVIQFSSIDTFQKKIDSQKKLHLFRVFQEVIINIVKHAKTKRISILVRITENYTAFSIQDFGVGFSNNSPSGLGLKNIELRTRQIKAQYKYKLNKPRGTRFLLISKHYE